MNKILSLALLALALAISSTLCAQVPQLISYQGRIAVGGVNFTGPGQFKFALVNSNGTTTYWSNAPDISPPDGEPDALVSLQVANGLYSVLLGDTAVTNMDSMAGTAFNNPDVRLRVWFNDGINGFQLLTPDQRIAAVGYAIMAADVPDGSITSAKIANGSISSSKLDAGAAAANLNASGQGGAILSGNGFCTAFNAATNSHSARGTALEAAVAAAMSGQTITVTPGTYLVTTSLAKDGVDLHLAKGVTIRRENRATEEGILDDGGSAMRFSVTGDGRLEFYNEAAGNKFDSACGAVACRNAMSAIYVECESIETSTNINDSGGPTVMAGYGVDGNLWINVKRETVAKCRGWVYGWVNGNMHVMCPRTYGDDYGIWAGVTATPTGDFFYRGNILETGHSEPVYSTSTQASSAMWVEALVVKTGAKSCVFHGGKNYLTCQKLYGGVVCAPRDTTTEVYVVAEKIQALERMDIEDTELICHRLDADEAEGFLHVTAQVIDINEKDNEPDGWKLRLESGKTYLHGGVLKNYKSGTSPWYFANGAELHMLGVVLEPPAGTIPIDVVGEGTVYAMSCRFIGNGGVDVRVNTTNGAAMQISGCLGSGEGGAVTRQNY